MIYRITNPLLISRIDELIDEIKFELPPQRIKEIIIDMLQNGEAYLFVEEKDSIPTGFMFASPVYYEGEPTLYIQFAYIRKGNPNTGHEILARYREVCKQRGLKRILFITHRKPEGFMRKYKFTLEGYVLSQEVNNEQSV